MNIQCIDANDIQSEVEYWQSSIIGFVFGGESGVKGHGEFLPENMEEQGT